jgi:hypothetical protein
MKALAQNGGSAMTGTADAGGIAAGTRVRMGEHELVFGENIEDLRDANALLGDPAALRARMEEDGYLLLRGFHDRALIDQARAEILDFMATAGKLHPDYPVAEGRIPDGNGGMMYPKDQYADIPAFIDVVEHPKLMVFFADFLEGPSLTFNYKWLRATGHEAFTGAHYDAVYMSRGTLDLYTCWTPLMDVPLAQGPLAVCLGSEHFEKVRETYGQMDVDRDKVRGWFSGNPLEINQKFGGRWASTNFAAGDIIIFGMFLMHGSLCNRTQRYRLTSDTRYQRADAPTDERWVGSNPKAHYAWMDGAGVSMEEARRNWGVG